MRKPPQMRGGFDRLETIEVNPNSRAEDSLNSLGVQDPAHDNDNRVDQLDLIRDLRLRRNCQTIFSELGPMGFYLMFAQTGAERGIRTYIENLAEIYASLDREELERLGRLHLPPALVSVVDGGRG